MKKKIIILIVLLSYCSSVSANETEDNLVNLVKKFDTAKVDIFLKNHPVGSIYETTNIEESTVEKMSDLYGGTWEVYGENKVLRGTTETVEKTGGQANITLSSNQVPSLSFSGTRAAQTVSSNSCNTCNGISVGAPTSYNTFYTSIDGYHTHGYNNGGNVIVVDAYNAGPAATSYGFVGNSAWWNGANKNVGTLANGGSHGHTFTDYYLNSVSGVAAHTHSVTSAAQTITSTYTNNSQSKINVLDPYITVYRYKRIA